MASAELKSLEDLVRAKLRQPVSEIVRRLIPELVREQLEATTGPCLRLKGSVDADVRVSVGGHGQHARHSADETGHPAQALHRPAADREHERAGGERHQQSDAGHQSSR